MGYKMELTRKEIKDLEEGMEEIVNKLIPNAKVKIIIPRKWKKNLI